VGDPPFVSRFEEIKIASKREKLAKKIVLLLSANKSALDMTKMDSRPGWGCDMTFDAPFPKEWGEGGTHWWILTVQELVEWAMTS
jgi:hypothetical protein